MNFVQNSVQYFGGFTHRTAQVCPFYMFRYLRVTILDLAKARQPGLQPRRVNVDFPEWMVEAMDQEAKRMGVTRQSIIKVWIAERLEKAPAH